MAIARVFAAIMKEHGWSPPEDAFETSQGASLKLMGAVATSQPKAAQVPPVVREHEHVIVIKGAFDKLSQLPVQPMQRLKQPWTIPEECSHSQELRVGSQLLRTTPLRSSGGILLLESSEITTKAESAGQAWGIPFSPETSRKKLSKGDIEGHFPSWSITSFRKPL